MSSNAKKNSSREELFCNQRKDTENRRKPPFPVWSRIHRIISERKQYHGLDYSGLPRISRPKVGIQLEEGLTLLVVIFAITIIFLCLDLT